MCYSLTTLFRICRRTLPGVIYKQKRDSGEKKKKKVKISKADYNTVTSKGARKDEQILLYCSEIPVRSVLPVSLGFAGGPGLGSSVDKQS